MTSTPPAARAPGRALDVRVLFRRLVGDSLRYTPAVLVPAAVSVTGVAVFTRLLDPDAYGAYALVIASVAIANIVSAGWIQQSALRYLPEVDAGRGRDVASAHVLGVVALTCASVVVVVAATRAGAGAWAGPGGGRWVRLLVPAGALLVAELAFMALGSVFLARLQSRRLSTFHVTSSVTRFAGALGLLLWFQRDVRWLLVGAAAGRGLVVVAMAAMIAHRAGGWIRPRLDRTMLRRFLAYGVPMVGWTLGSQVLALSDRFVIGAFRGSGDVGIYSANYNLVAMGFGLLSGPLLMAAHPLIMNAWKERDTSAPDVSAAGGMPGVIATFSSLYIVVALPLTAVLAVCSREVVGILLGQAFREGYRIVPVLVAGSFAWGFAMYGQKGLEIKERTLVMFGLVGVTALLNLALNLIFVPAYGYPAAAFTTLASYLVYPVLVHRATRRHLAWRIPWAILAEAAVAAVIAGGVGALVRAGLAGVGPVAVAAASAAATVAVYGALVAARSRLRRVLAGGGV